MRGTYQHCGSQHLRRYLDELFFPCSKGAELGVNDKEPLALALKGAEGKRLTYRQPRSVE
jgi:hypothetical protein